MGDIKFEALKEGQQKPDKSQREKKNALSMAELEKSAGIKPKEEIRRAEPVTQPVEKKEDKKTPAQEVISLKKERGVLPKKYDRQAIGDREQDI